MVNSGLGWVFVTTSAWSPGMQVIGKHSVMITGLRDLISELRMINPLAPCLDLTNLIRSY